jgi:hypothetical protein
MKPEAILAYAHTRPQDNIVFQCAVAERNVALNKDMSSNNNIAVASYDGTLFDLHTGKYSGEGSNYRGFVYYCRTIHKGSIVPHCSLVSFVTRRFPRCILLHAKGAARASTTMEYISPIIVADVWQVHIQVYAIPGSQAASWRPIVSHLRMLRCMKFCEREPRPDMQSRQCVSRMRRNFLFAQVTAYFYPAVLEHSSRPAYHREQQG